MTDQCFECDGSAGVVRGPREVRLGDRLVTVEGEFMRCGDCGEEYYVGGQMRELHRRAVAEVRRQEGFLTPEEIRGVRQKYRLSQAAFETLINAGPTTATRWEGGTVAPSGAADTLLRILRDHPDAVWRLAAQRGVSIHVEPSSLYALLLNPSPLLSGGLQCVEQSTVLTRGGEIRDFIEDVARVPAPNEWMQGTEPKIMRRFQLV
jgi:putative zinc finger/helix-turn-helix YgiT family protein